VTKPKKARKASAKKRPPARKVGRPSIWTPELETRIFDKIKTTGCSYQDAAVVCGLSYETLKARQRENPEFSANLAGARTHLKVRSLELLNDQCEAGNVTANTWRLSRLWPEEFHVSNKLEVSGAVGQPGGNGGDVRITNLTNIIVANDEAGASYYAAIRAFTAAAGDSEPRRLPDGDKPRKP